MAQKHDYMLRLTNASPQKLLPCGYHKYGRFQCKKIVQKGPGPKIIYCDQEVILKRAADVSIARRVECNATEDIHSVSSLTSFIGVCENARKHNDCSKLIICKQCMEQCIGGAQTWSKRKYFPFNTEYYPNYYEYKPKGR